MSFGYYFYLFPFAEVCGGGVSSGGHRLSSATILNKYCLYSVLLHSRTYCRGAQELGEPLSLGF